MSAADNQPPTPSADELEQVALPAVVRRTPRLARVIVSGALAGVLFGVALGMLLPGGGTAYRATVVILTTLSFAFLGALVAGAVASRPTSNANPARIGLVIGIVGAALLVILTWEGKMTASWSIVSIVVMVGIPFFARMIGKSFAVDEPPSAAENSEAFEKSMKVWAAGQQDKPAAKKAPAAKKKSAAKAPAKKPAAARTTKGK